MQRKSNAAWTIAAVAVLLAALALPGQAGTMVFGSRADWEGALVDAPLTEDFNTVVDTVNFGISSTTVGDLTLTGGASTDAEIRVCGQGIFACQSNAPVSPLVASFGMDPGESFTVSLGGIFTAFGFDFSNGDPNGDGLSLIINGVSVASVTGGLGATGFIGVTSSDPFSSIVVRNDNISGDARNAFDNFGWGTAAEAPNPATVSLIAAGLLAVRLRHRR